MVDRPASNVGVSTEDAMRSFRLPCAFTVLALSVLALGACSGAAVLPATSDGPIVGAWGGPHAALVLADSGGTIQYDCAHGRLHAPLRPDGAGHFVVAGVHVREHGGPTRVDEVADSVPAQYVGDVAGDRMTLRVFAGLDTLGPFALVRDAAPQLVRCL